MLQKYFTLCYGSHPSATTLLYVVAVVFLICCQQHPIDRPSFFFSSSSVSFDSTIYEDKETIRSYICGTELVFFFLLLLFSLELGLVFLCVSRQLHAVLITRRNSLYFMHLVVYIYLIIIITSVYVIRLRFSR